MKLFDSHAHYFDHKFDTIEGGAHAILTSPEFADAVSHVINVGTNPETNRRCIEQTARYDFMWCAIGIHPEDCQHLERTPDDVLAELYAQLSDPASLRRDKIVAIGEIGFDYYWQPVNKELQREYFLRQLAMARELDLPVIIHDREAHGDCFDMVKQYKGVRGVFHCYSGSDEMAKELLKLGWYLSFGGPVTYKNAEKVRRAAKVVPLDRLLLETDCPYLTPVPYRGKRNESSYVKYVRDKVAEIKRIEPQRVDQVTTYTAKQIFGI